MAPVTVRHDPLKHYSAKRNFKVTAEPKGIRAKNRKTLSFVIQKHWASSLHYDFRLELDGVLLSWAVPKGPCYDPKVKRMAVHVEDHPVSYGEFEGNIPAKQYGAGNVIVWDRGAWEAIGSAQEGISKGKLLFKLHGEKLAGLWELIRTSKATDKQDKWLLFKKRDEWARSLADYDVITVLPDSVVAKPLGRIEERESPIGEKIVDALPVKYKGGSDAEIAGAIKAKLPVKMQPQLATLVKAMPTDGDWLYEVKFDGYRIMARIDKRKVRLFTRGGHDWSAKMTSLVDAIESLGINSGWLDGEIVVFNNNGLPSFNALQNSFDSSQTESITYFIFDAPFFEGHDLRQVPLHARRQLLKQLLDVKGTDTVRFSEDFAAAAENVLQSACKMGLEGIIAKRKDSAYLSKRTESWLKLKCSQRQEFVIVGFNDRAGTSGEIGSLMLGYYENGQLCYAGNVGTGWNTASRTDLYRRLAKIEIKRSKIDNISTKRSRWSSQSDKPHGSEHWVKPLLVAEVSFAEWTPDGHIRHASFQGLRSDKPAGKVSREISKASVNSSGEPGRESRVRSMKVSHGDRVIDASTGLTKLDLIRYYESVAKWIMPHLKGRAVSLLRAPRGIGEQQFFQKHDSQQSIPGLRLLDSELLPGHESLIEIPDVEALISAAQMNVVEFHTWNSTTRNINKPNRIVFDLDPGKDVSWAHVREASVLVKTLLTELGLTCWLKTSGGRGLHVVVPLTPRLDAEIVKGFSRAFVQHLVNIIPTRFVVKSGAKNRVGKIFVDYLRNGHGQTTAAAFSARARPGLGVSMPIGWDELQQIKTGAQWTISTAREYLSFRKTDPWNEYWETKQTLTHAIKSIGFQPEE